MSADNWTDCPQCGGGETLREDYKFHTVNGVVNVYYGCSCDSCGFNDSFTYEHQLTIDPAIMADILLKKKKGRIEAICKARQLLDDELVKFGGS